jgi:integrase
MHDLLYSHASYLINVFNENPVAVAKRLGHKDVSETLNTYSHLYPDGQFKIAEKIEEHQKNVTKMLSREKK